jgi:hypothetical protein
VTSVQPRHVAEHAPILGGTLEIDVSREALDWTFDNEHMAGAWQTPNPPTETVPDQWTRHCERSKAIQNRRPLFLDCHGASKTRVNALFVAPLGSSQ